MMVECAISGVCAFVKDVINCGVVMLVLLVVSSVGNQWDITISVLELPRAAKISAFRLDRYNHNPNKLKIDTRRWIFTETPTGFTKFRNFAHFAFFM